MSCSVPRLLKRLIPALQDFADRSDESDCRVHDAAYFVGGSSADRITADYILFLGVKAKCGDEIAAVVFDAVRNFGATRWGTGQPWHGGERAWPEPQEAP